MKFSVPVSFLLHAASFVSAAFKRAEDIPREIVWERFKIDLEKPYTEQPSISEIRHMVFENMVKQRAIPGQGSAVRAVSATNLNREITTGQPSSVTKNLMGHRSVPAEKPEELRKRKRSEGSFEEPRYVEQQKRARKLYPKTLQTQERPRRGLKVAQREALEMSGLAASQSVPASRKPTIISGPRRLSFPKEVERSSRSSPIPATVILTEPPSIAVPRRNSVKMGTPAASRPAPSSHAAKIFDHARRKKSTDKSSPPNYRLTSVPLKPTIISSPQRLRFLQQENNESSVSRSSPVSATIIISDPQSIKVRRLKKTTERGRLVVSRFVPDPKPTIIADPKRINFIQNETVGRSPSRQTLIIPEPRDIKYSQIEQSRRVVSRSAPISPPSRFSSRQQHVVPRQKTVEMLKRPAAAPAPSQIRLEQTQPKSILKKKAENQLQNPVAKARKTVTWGAQSVPMVQERTIAPRGKFHKTPSQRGYPFRRGSLRPLSV